MDQSHIREIHGLKYFVGSHPEIKAHFRAGNRPKEFGNRIWATSLVFIDYLRKNPTRFHNLNVLEIGCGQGIIGLYLAKFLVCNVTSTDIDECVFPILDMQANLNKVKIQTMRKSFNDLSPSFLQNFDCIIGAEVCYDDVVVKDLISLFDRAFHSGVSEIILADPGRPDFNDCYMDCKQRFQVNLELLPGSINGKQTHFLSIANNKIK